MRAYGLRFLRIQKHTYARKTRNVYISSLDDVFWRIPAIATSGGAVLKLWNAFRTNDGRGISAETVFIKNNSGATFCLPFSTVVFGVKFETKSTQVSADKSTPHTCAFVAGEFSIPKKRCGVPSECMHKDTPNVPIITTAMSIAETSLFIKRNIYEKEKPTQFLCQGIRHYSDCNVPQYMPQTMPTAPNGFRPRIQRIYSNTL